MNVKTPIASTDPFRTCRIAAAVLALLTAALITATAIDLARRPKAGDHRWAIGSIAPALATPIADTAGIDTRYGPMVPTARYVTGGRGPWESRP